MLLKPLDSRPYRIVGIDPASKLMGVSVIDLHLDTRQAVLLHAQTFNAEHLIRNYQPVISVHGERTARLMAIEDTLHGFFHYWEPHCIISESPYMGRFPQAFATLTECVTAIRRATYRYDPYLPLRMVDPMTAKAAVGVSTKGRAKVGKGKHRKTDLTKDDVKVGLLLQPLHNPNGIDIQQLDEHSVDATAVAYSRVQFILQNL